MKSRLAPASLATHLHLPLRFGKRWRGHELPLRLAQLALLLWLGVAGSRVIAHGVAMGGQALIGMMS